MCLGVIFGDHGRLQFKQLQKDPYRSLDDGGLGDLAPGGLDNGHDLRIEFRRQPDVKKIRLGHGHSPEACLWM